MNLKNRMGKWGLSLLLITMPWVSSALAPQWQMLPSESQLTFSATQNGALVTGQFKTFTATIFFDPQTLKDSSIVVVVDISSLSTSYAALKATLVTADWFNVKLFPKAEFRTTQVNKTGDKTYQAIGMLSIRDKSVPTTLTFMATKLESNNAVMTGSTVIKRSVFGVGQGEWASTNEIKNDVIINFKVTAVKK